MKDTIKIALIAALVAVGVDQGVARALPRILAFTASPLPWTTAFEAEPENSESISLADDQIRQKGQEVRRRVEVEHDFGSGFGNVTTDTGRHLEGSARCFVQATPPTVNGLITANCLLEADTAGNRGCDEGRCWIDTDGPDNIAANSDDYTYNVAVDSDSDGDADSWTPIKAGSTGGLAETGTPNRIIVRNGLGTLVEHTGLSNNRLMITDAQGLPAVSSVTATEAGYLAGVTSAIQTQLTNIPASSITSGTFADARISASSVVQHEYVVRTVDEQPTVNAFSYTKDAVFDFLTYRRYEVFLSGVQLASNSTLGFVGRLNGANIGNVHNFNNINVGSTGTITGSAGVAQSGANFLPASSGTKLQGVKMDIWYDSADICTFVLINGVGLSVGTTQGQSIMAINGRLDGFRLTSDVANITSIGRSVIYRYRP